MCAKHVEMHTSLAFLEVPNPNGAVADAQKSSGRTYLDFPITWTCLDAEEAYLPCSLHYSEPSFLGCAGSYCPLYAFQHNPRPSL